jgi:hypothetical protein
MIEKVVRGIFHDTVGNDDRARPAMPPAGQFVKTADAGDIGQTGQECLFETHEEHSDNAIRERRRTGLKQILMGNAGLARPGKPDSR